MARAREFHRLGRELDQAERGLDQRIGAEGPAERDVERQRRLCLARQVVAGLHHAREDARHFLPALAELGDDDADALLAFLEPRPRPLRRRFELLLRRGERRAGAGAGSSPRA